MRTTLTFLLASAAAFGQVRSSAFATLQQAIDSGAAHVLVDQDYGLDVTNLPSGLTLELRPGVVLQAVEDGFTNKYDALLSCRNQANVTIIGYGAFIQGRAGKFDGQNTHAVEARGCSNFRVEGVTIRYASADGIYIGADLTRKRIPCSNVTIKNVRIERAWRNGIGVIAVDGLLIDNAYVTGTNGTMPKSGIDFEPVCSQFADGPCDPIRNVLVRNAQFVGNGERNIFFAFHHYDDRSQPISISFENTLSMGGAARAGVEWLEPDSGSLKGFADLGITSCDTIGPQWKTDDHRMGACGLMIGGFPIGDVILEQASKGDR